MSETAERHEERAWSMPLAEIDVSDPELYAEDGWQPYFKWLRQEDPVHYTAASPYGPYWSVTRFDDCIEVDRDHELFSAEPTVTIGDPPVSDRPPPEMFIQMDPPRHDQRRKTVQPAVAPRNLENLEPLIRERAGSILDQLPVGETFDWVQHVAINLTSRMLATLFDFPQEERDKLILWSDVFTDNTQTSGSSKFTGEERSRAARECLQTFSRIFAERRAAPPGEQFDLISMLAHGPATHDLIERPEELLGTLILLIVGGNDTTRNSISGGVLALNQFPAEYDKLSADTTLIGSMVPEIIRWQSPVLHIRRTMTRDAELCGRQLRKGEKLVMWYVSGNRDELAFERPDDFIIDRPNPRHHLSFGFGIHRCMGNRLAEMQLRVLWEEIVRRFSRVEVVGPPRRLASNQIRGIRELPVRLHR
jgi:cytochrome P450